ncbi:MAG: DNA photolyase family protein [Nitrosomonadaceae bacterium]|jgi:deoxyribodipyrimidine photo-lyase|nr:DNA photolyase family protein [Nitrosomonadaceae bacterium]
MSSALFWFRRDLRVDDNVGLAAALHAARRVYCVFVFDRDILDQLPSRQDRRVEFIWESVLALRQDLRQRGGDLLVMHAAARDAIPALAAQLRVETVFTNEDYEPDAVARDEAVRRALDAQGISFETRKDTVIFAKDEVRTQSGGVYSVFTPYKNAWRKKLSDDDLREHRIDEVQTHLATPVQAKNASKGAPVLDFDAFSLEAMGFGRTNLSSLGVIPGSVGADKLLQDFLPRIARYKDARDLPAVKGVSYLSVHNRFGTVSIRRLASLAYAEVVRGTGIGAETWLNELVWRDFYFQIIWHHPHAAKGAFRPEYDALQWPNDETLFRAWCDARTGYPIIDAAMQQINQTGYMHNRLRMIVASFLTKDLLIDWRWGEKYFADNLIDFDLSANNGGWQWAASTGCDAQPYFRIFNPVTQSERFDAEGKFIRRYLPALAKVPNKFIHAPWTMPPLDQQAAGCIIGRDYPAPIVDHAVQREKALSLFGAVKKLAN